MGTKINPGAFDCYANALADEPMFILLARDPQAPAAVEFWAEARGRAAVISSPTARPDLAKAREAQACADAMRAWRRANDGRWREPAPAINGSTAAPGQLTEVRPDGWAGIMRDDEVELNFLYAGVRAAALGPDPRDPTKEVLSFVGGTQDQPEVVADAVTFTLSEAGLRALAADLLAAAERNHRRNVIDARFVV